MVGSDTLLPVITIQSDVGGTMTLQRDLDQPLVLNNSLITIEDVQFRRCRGDDGREEYILTTFPLRAKSSNGQLVSQDFFTTNVLHN